MSFSVDMSSQSMYSPYQEVGTMAKTVDRVKFRITGGLKHGWIQEPHTYEVFFTDGTSQMVEAFKPEEAAKKTQVAS